MSEYVFVDVGPRETREFFQQLVSLLFTGGLNSNPHSSNIVALAGKNYYLFFNLQLNFTYKIIRTVDSQKTLFWKSVVEL